MQAQDLINIIRQDYLFDVIVPYRWSDAFLLRAIIESEHEACNRWNFIYDDFTTSITQINLIDGVATYSLSQKITKIEDIIITYPYSIPSIGQTKINKKSKIELDAHYPCWRTNTGIIKMSGRNPVCIVRNQTIRFSPIPSASLDATYNINLGGTPSAGQTWWDGATLWQYSGSSWVANPTAPLAVVQLECYRLPLADTITSTYVPEIPAEHHMKLIFWALYRCYSKRDVDAAPGANDVAANYTTPLSYNNALALTYQKQFTDWFGEPVSASARQNQMEEDPIAVFRPHAYESPMTRDSHDDHDW